MGEGIPVIISLAAVVTLLVTFRSGVGLIPKLIAWLLLAWLLYFYWVEISVFYTKFSQVGLKMGVSKAAERLFTALPIVFFVLMFAAFFINSAKDSARVLWMLFSLGLIAIISKLILTLV